METTRSAFRRRFSDVLAVLSAVALMAVGSACGKASGGGSDIEQGDATDAADTAPSELAGTGSANGAPTAEAGSDSSVAVGEEVVLNAGGSSDPDGDLLAYEWAFESTPDGASAMLNGAQNVAARFTPQTAGTFELSVTVSDGSASDTDRVSIEVRSAPTAETGPDRTGKVGEVVQLDASGSMASDGEELEFSWSFVSKPEQSSAGLRDPSTAMASFEPDVQGAYVVELTVSNGPAAASDRVTIEVAPPGGRLSSTVYVSPNGDDDNLGTESEPLQTVGAAIRVANDEDRVRRVVLAEGTYQESGLPHEITSDLDIVGPSDDQIKAVIKGGDDDMFAVDQGAFATFLDVSVETSSTVVDVGDDAGLSWVGVTCRASFCIESGHLVGGDGPGGRIQVRRSTLIDAASGGAGTGILAVSTDGITVVDSTIKEFSDYGIQVVNAAMTVRDTTIEDNEVGINLLVNKSANATRIDGVRFKQNAKFGLESEGAENVFVEGSKLTGGVGTGFLIKGGAVRLDDIHLEGVFGDGLRVLGDALVTLRDSVIRDHGRDGVRVEGEGALVDMGTASEDGNNTIDKSFRGQVHDLRPDSASSPISMSETVVGTSQPPPGTYSGPNFYDHGITIDGDTTVIVH